MTYWLGCMGKRRLRETETEGRKVRTKVGKRRERTRMGSEGDSEKPSNISDKSTAAGDTIIVAPGNCARKTVAFHHYTVMYRYR